MQTHEPVKVMLAKGNTEDLSKYLDMVELPIRLEPLIGGLFKRTLIDEAELKNYITNRGGSKKGGYSVILADGEQVSLTEYQGLTKEQIEAVFHQILLPFGITNIYEMDLINFINSLERPKVRQRVM